MFATTINDLVDAHNDRDDGMPWVKNKLTDIEDRSRRNNLKIRGVPESIQQGSLHSYTTNMFKSTLPDTKDLVMTIDRIHRLPKPSHLPDKIPRDVILHLHFFHVKERIMSAAHNKSQIPSQYADLQFYSET